MQIFYLTTFYTIVLDFAAWFLIHIGLSVFTYKLSDSYFKTDKVIYVTREWEQNGLIYEKIFRVKKWKHLLPDGAAIFKKGFTKKNIVSKETKYFDKFILESRRAEFTHWLTIFSAVLFFFWNSFSIGLIMILYAFLSNLPCIISQRYNRSRLKKILKK